MRTFGNGMPSILVVGDDAAGHQALCHALHDAGFAVRAAAAAGDAAHEWETERPDLILLGADLRDGDGPELCRRLKADPATAGVPVLALSHHAAAWDGEADDVLLLPMSPAQVIARIRAWLWVAQAADRRAQRDALQSALHETLTAAGIVAWDWDPESDALRGSDDAERLVGTPLHRGAAFLERIHPDDRPHVVSRLRTALADRTEYAAEFRIVHAGSGAVQWLECRGRVVRDEQGRPRRLLGVLLDITRRKESEAVLRESESLLERRVWQRTAELRAAQEAVQASERRFRAIIEQSHDAFVIMTPDGTITYASPSVERIGGRPVAEVVGRNAFEWSHPEDAATAAGQLQEFNHRPGESITVRHRYRHQDGSWRWVEVTSTNFLEEPSVRGIVCILHDVTEAQRMEEQLRQAQKMEAVGTLAGGVAHDFNNLLTAIGCCTELLRDTADDPATVRALTDEIQKAAGRAAALTRQLLAFSRKQIFQQVVFHLNDLITELERMLRRTLGEDVELVTSLDPHLSRIKADPGQIEQVIVNLAVNARDAMPRGGRLTIATHNRAPDGQVLLTVSDTGCGMDESVLAHIFEPFFTTKGAGRGTGLGLATVYGIVEQSGGRIAVQSEVGRGTTFEVSLPAVAEAPSHAGPSPGPSDPPRGTETILVAEDEESVRTLAGRLLQQLGYTVLPAAGGSEALEIARRHAGPIDLLLTDVVMPGMGGAELADRLTALRPEVKVLSMSGYTDDAVIRYGVSRAATPFLPKPFTRDTLARKVRDALGVR